MFFNLNQYLSVLMAVLFANSFIFPVLLIPFLALTVVSFCITLKAQYYIMNKQIFFIFFIIVISILLPIVKSSSLYDVKVGIFLICSILFSYTLSYLKPIKSLTACLLPLLFSLVMFTYYAFNGISAEDFFPLNSRNFVAVTLFLGLFAYFALSKNYTVRGRLIVLNLAICFFCIYAVGRAGIVLSFVLLAFYSLNYVIDVTKKFKRESKLLVRVLMLMSVFTILVFLIDYLYTNDFLVRIISRGMHDLSRKNIIKEYLSSLDGTNLILGVKLAELELMNKFNNNLHNSYLSVHSSFGLIYSLFFMFLVSYSLVLSWRRKYYPVLFLMLVILARGVSDIQVLAGRGDWVFYFVLFYLIQSQQQMKKLVKVQILHTEKS